MKNNTKKKPVLSFTVDTKKWRCGGEGANKLGKGDTALLNNQGYMCCLGFACRQAGYKGKMKDDGCPSDTNTVLPGLTRKYKYDDEETMVISTVFCDKAIDINDSSSTTVEQKKQKLIALGKRHNIEIKFK